MPSARRLLSKIYHLKSGFTLIELLVVISIIGILVATSAASYTRAQQKARDGKRKTDLKGIQQALEFYYQTNNKYPSNALNIFIRCNVTGDTSVKQWGQPFTCGSTTYMNPLPKDPAYPSSYYKYTGIGGNTYQIHAMLENSNDQDYCDPSTTDCVTTNKLPCQPVTGFTYCQVNP